MTDTKTDMLKVPGATLYYETRGSGPVLLMIPGGPADAGVFARIAPILADRYRVVLHDPRGNSRSSLDSAPEDWKAEVHADDASRLLAEVGDGPAFVFGNSGGALVALALALRHPEQVRVVVAHEPPVMELLPDRERHREEGRAIYEVYQREGAGAAMGRFLAGAGLARGASEAGPRPGSGAGPGAGSGSGPGPQAPPDPETQQMMARVGRNIETFIVHTLRQVGAYVPDLDALRTGSTRIVVAVGEGSRGTPVFDATHALAARLGTPAVEFPGDHGGFTSRPEAFAKTLTEVLYAAPAAGAR